MIGENAVSGFVITCNEEGNIEDCLRSLAWCDERIVVDSGSEDRTVQIARRHADRVLVQEFLGYTAQTRFAAEQTTMPWIMWLDADERLTGRAVAEIRSFLSGPGAENCAGMKFP